MSILETGGRIIDGLTGGNISVLFGYVADITEPKDRGKYFGMLGSAAGVGSLIGPVFGGLLATGLDPGRWANSTPIRPLGERDVFKNFLLAGIRRVASLIPELEAESGVQIEYEQTGTLRVLPAELSVLRKQKRRCYM